MAGGAYSLHSRRGPTCIYGEGFNWAGFRTMLLLTAFVQLRFTKAPFVGPLAANQWCLMSFRGPLTIPVMLRLRLVRLTKRHNFFFFFLFFFLDQSNGRFKMFQMERCFSRLIAFTTSEMGRVKIRGIGFVRSPVSRVEKGQQNVIPG